MEGKWSRTWNFLWLQCILIAWKVERLGSTLFYLENPKFQVFPKYFPIFVTGLFTLITLLYSIQQLTINYTRMRFKTQRFVMYGKKCLTFQFKILKSRPRLSKNQREGGRTVETPLSNGNRRNKTNLLHCSFF